MSIQIQSFNPSIQRVGIVRSYARKNEIVREGDPADHVYEVVSGTVCTCKMLREGRRQITGFYSTIEIAIFPSGKLRRAEKKLETIKRFWRG